MPIEQLAPEFANIISANAEIARHTPDDYGGDNGPAEGPVWWSDGGYLLFSDIHNNRRIKYVPGQGASVDHEPTNRANGLTRDLQGRLIACEHDSRRVTRTEPDGSITVVAASFQGRPLNRPNDVVVKSDGCIYFTDPWTLPTPATQFDQTFSGVYRVTPDLGSITLLVDDYVVPNGLAFSPDESVLYINDSRRGHIRSFEVSPNGSLARQTGPGVRRPDRLRAGSARRYEGGRGGKRVLRRLRRPVGDGRVGQEAGRGSTRRIGHHQPVLRRRRLEDALLHQPQPPGLGADQHCRHPSAREIRKGIKSESAGKGLNRPFLRSLR